MSIRHLPPIALAGILATWGGVSPAAAQPAAQPAFVPPSFLAPKDAKLPGEKPSGEKPATAKPADSKASDPPPIAFFVATGPNACGPGCDGWIAAEGKIDLYAAQRLRKVLAKLGRRKLPLFLHSGGGAVLGAIELGRLIRSRNIEVSVARTIPAECPPDQRDKACETLKRSGRDLVSELDWSGGMCNSACVLVLAGGAMRSVPPWVRLGVHAIGIDLGKTPMRGPAVAAATRLANSRIVEFLHDMGIPKALFDASNAIPHESTRFLQRDEIMRFGLDTRDFGETDWRFIEKPNVAIAKGFFVHAGGADPVYPEGLLRLNCSAGKAVRLTFARERAASTVGSGSRPVRITVNGMRIDLPYASQAGKIEMRTTALWPDAIASAGDSAAVEISGLDAAGESKPQDGKSEANQSPHSIVLNMAGFSAAYAKLRKACDDSASVGAICGAELSPRCMPEALQNWHAVAPVLGGNGASPAR